MSLAVCQLSALGRSKTEVDSYEQRCINCDTPPKKSCGVPACQSTISKTALEIRGSKTYGFTNLGMLCPKEGDPGTCKSWMKWVQKKGLNFSAFSQVGVGWQGKNSSTKRDGYASSKCAETCTSCKESQRTDVLYVQWSTSASFSAPKSWWTSLSASFKFTARATANYNQGLDCEGIGCGGFGSTANGTIRIKGSYGMFGIEGGVNAGMTCEAGYSWSDCDKADGAPRRGVIGPECRWAGALDP